MLHQTSCRIHLSTTITRQTLPIGQVADCDNQISVLRRMVLDKSTIGQLSSDILSITEPQQNVGNPNHHYFSKKYCNTPPICIAIRLQLVLQCFAASLPLSSQEREIRQYSSHLYRSAPPICIAVPLPFVSQYASHFYRNTFGKILVVVVTGMFPRTPSQRPHPDPTQHPKTDPKRTRNGPKTDRNGPKRT